MKRLATDKSLHVSGTARVTRMFFDRQAVIDAVGRGNVKVLSKAGAFVRRTAKGKIRYSKNVSEPGRPPRAHRGRGGKSPLRELIFFSLDPQTRSVVIGPVPLSGPAIVPRVLERGGIVGARPNLLRRLRRVGDGGEIVIGGRPCRTTKKNRFGAMVTYVKLRTQTQADRANQLQEELYGPMTIGPASIEARPYMGPSLQENLPKLPPLWANSVS